MFYATTRVALQRMQLMKTAFER